VLLLDNSAWARRLQVAARDRIAAAIASKEAVVCLPLLLEAGYSARSAAEHDTLIRDLGLLPRVDMGNEIERLALRAQGELAAVGHHRLSPNDLIVAACAHHAGHGVLHYDRDYDVIAAHTSLEFASEWVAPAGSLD
jgi:predicted nucleic acid-binding protein